MSGDWEQTFGRVMLVEDFEYQQDLDIDRNYIDHPGGGNIFVREWFPFIIRDIAHTILYPHKITKDGPLREFYKPWEN